MIYVTGDTHGSIDLKKLNAKNFPDNQSLSKTDFLIITGDFGLIWHRSKEETYWLQWLEAKHFTTLFVDGNHENFDRLDNYPTERWNGGNIHRISDSVIHLMRGQVFIIQGIKIFTFGGAASHDREIRTEGKTWWPGEMPAQTEFDEGLANLSIHDWTVDYLITHTCPSVTSELCGRLETSPINLYFDQIEAKVKYRHWYFGHFHQDIREIEPHKTVLYHQIIKLT